jgi:Ni/Fe-hydrogenase subunit HybB-like protein
MRDRSRHLKDILWGLAIAGVVAVCLRLWFGLGATTNLDDAVPWGLWKILNMVAGVALATGGFTVGLLATVLHVKRLQPLVRPAILIALLGYGSSVVALLFDIGLPHRIWHPIVMWNPRSFLFEVALCVMAYLTVTIVEMFPVVLERGEWLEPVRRVLHRFSTVIIILGITLSSLHHTSLGSLFLVTPQRLHPLWYTGWLPVLFITSAMGAGMMVVVLASLLYDRMASPSDAAPDAVESVRVCVTPTATTQTGTRTPLLALLASVAAGILGLHLVLRVVDLIRTGAWRNLVAGTWESWFCGSEIALLCVVPVIVMAIPSARRSRVWLAVAAASAASGLVVNRLNVGVFGYFRDAGRIYVPSLGEWALSLGVIAAAGLVFLFAVEHLPVFDDQWRGRRSAARRFHRRFDSLSGVWTNAFSNSTSRVSLIVVLTAPLAFTLLYPPFFSDGLDDAAVVHPPRAEDVQRAILVIDGNHRATAVRFAHAEHRERLGGNASCTACHHLAMPGDHATPCSRCHRHMEAATAIFDHTRHLTAVAERESLRGLAPGNHSCSFCHAAGLAESPTTARSCLECHRTDMRPVAADDLTTGVASGYRVALHKTCRPCHHRESIQRSRPEMVECRFCHVRPTGHETPSSTDLLVASNVASTSNGIGNLRAGGVDSPMAAR